MKTMPQTGDAIIIQSAPGYWKRFRGRIGKVVRLDEDGWVSLELDQAEDEDAPPYLRDYPVAYIEIAPVDGAKPKRRSPLNLSAPRDTRSEAERQFEGVSWLRSLGYTVIETDTHRGKAVCGKCTREQKRRVYVHCSACGAPGFSPTTGADAGLADTEVQHAERWSRAPGVPAPSMNVEWKAGEKAERRPAQEARELRGEIVVVWDKPGLARAVVAFEQSLGVAPLAAVLRFTGEEAEML